MGWLDGQVAIITGGGSGLGRALVDTFVEEGARVVVLQQSPGKIARLREETDPAWVQVVAGDARTYESNAATVAVALEKFGQLDCFIANAGVWDFGRTVTNSTPAELDAGFDEVFALNVKAALMGMAAAVEPLRASRGSFIMSLSNAALYPGGGGPLYVASKHAGVGLVKQLAYDLAPDIRVNAVAPAGMKTPLRGPASMGLAETTLEDLPFEEMVSRKSALRRCPEAIDYAGAYILLASRRYGLTTSGAVLDVANAKGLIGRVADDLLDFND